MTPSLSRSALAWLAAGFLTLAPAGALLRAQDDESLTGKAARAEDDAAVIQGAKDLLPQVEKLRHLKFKEEVNVGVYSRDELKQYLLKSFEDELPPEVLEAAQASLIKFGLIPADCDLGKTYLEVLGEQIAGFYDPESKELRLIREADKEEDEEDANDMAKAMQKQMEQMLGIDMQDIISIHELDHAMQDQHFQLKTLPMDNEDNDDLSTALKCLVEGEATYVMYLPVAKKTKALGVGMEQLADQMGAESPPGMDSGSLAKAPLVIKEGLVFPYMGGIKFVMKAVEAAKAAAGKDWWPEYNKIYDNPPASTEQILHADKFLGEKRDFPQVLRIPDLSGDLGGSKPLGDNVIGELGAQILFKTFGLKKFVARVCEGWDGDRYHIYRAEGKKTASLVWMTTWDSEDDARDFFSYYTKLIGKKYPDAKRGEEEPEAAEGGKKEVPLLRTWTEATGAIRLERKGNDVLVLESISADTIGKIAGKIWSGTTRKELTQVERVEPKKKDKKPEAGAEKPAPDKPKKPAKKAPKEDSPEDETDE